MQILSVVNTPFELYYLSSVIYLLKMADPQMRARLLVARGTLPKINPEISGLYADVQTIDPARLRGNPRQDLSASLRFEKQIAGLDLSADIVLISSFREYFGNILCRHLHKGCRLVALRMSDEKTETHFRVRKPLHAFYMNTFNVLFGFSPMHYRWHIDPKTGSLIYWYVRSPYQRTICISDWGQGQSGTTYRLSSPFAALRKYYGVNQNGEENSARPILVVGERTPLYPVWNAQDQAIYESIFDFLRKNFSERGLFFKPRTGLTDINTIPLDGFQLIPGELPFEELCLRNQYSRVISIKSTASKVAAYCGLPAYALYPLFHFPRDIWDQIDSYLSDVQSLIRVNDLEQLLQEPIATTSLDIEALSQQYYRAILRE